MPRANRHYIPGYVWHITHRCQKKESLLKLPETAGYGFSVLSSQ